MDKVRKSGRTVCQLNDDPWTNKVGVLHSFIDAMIGNGIRVFFSLIREGWFAFRLDCLRGFLLRSRVRSHLCYTRLEFFLQSPLQLETSSSSSFGVEDDL